MMRSATYLPFLAALVCAVVVGAVIAGIVAFRELASMARNLDDTTAKLQSVDRQLSSMNGKLSKTNDLLLRTNASLGTMVAESKAADAKLTRMGGDISVMSHKLAGSFLFRGVK